MVVVQHRSAVRAVPPARPRARGWQLLRRLGRGAWTDVFQARPEKGNPASPGDYAIKLLRPECAGDGLAVAMLQREAFVARQVQHVNLATVLAAHTEEPPYYLVLPRHEGATLKDRVARGERMPLPQMIWIVRQAAEAAAALHAAGWLHGDIQPGNLIIGPTGHTTLIDLGLARKFEEGYDTGQQTLQGTPAYMAPECFQCGIRLTPAADVYSLGVVLYELLIGQRPFTDDDPLELMTAHLETPPPSLRVRMPHLPTRAARLVRKMLAKEPLRRPCVGELIATLMAIEIDTFAERVTPLARAG